MYTHSLVFLKIPFNYRHFHIRGDPLDLCGAGWWRIDTGDLFWNSSIFFYKHEGKQK